MYSERFQKFIEMWQKDFAIERTIDEKVCVDRDGNPLPWYTYPAIEYLSQFDYGEKTIFEFGCGYSSLFWGIIYNISQKERRSFLRPFVIS